MIMVIEFFLKGNSNKKTKQQLCALHRSYLSSSHKTKNYIKSPESVYNAVQVLYIPLHLCDFENENDGRGAVWTVVVVVI